jgi:hypothetical protein
MTLNLQRETRPTGAHWGGAQAIVRDAETEHRHAVRDAAQSSIGPTMTSDTPVHDWLRPRLADLVQQAERAGFLREAVVAVIMDLMTAPPYDDAPPPVE